MHSAEQLVARLERRDRTDESRHDGGQRQRIDADVPHLAYRLGRIGLPVGERARNITREVAPLPNLAKRTEWIPDQVLTRAKRMTPTTPNMMLGSHAARSAGIIPLPPIPFVSWMSIRKITVVARLRPIP